MDFLLDLARDRSRESKSRLVRILGDLFSESGSVLTVQERALMTDILRNLIKDVETAVRRSLAERLATVAEAPRELVRALANDAIEVAYPLLVRSKALEDIDLIEIVQLRTAEHRLAVAMRDNVSSEVADALVEAGDENLLLALLENPRADISASAMEYLVEASRRIAAYQRPLLSRRELTEELARRMYWWVSQALRERIIERFAIDPGTLDETIEQTVAGLVEEDRRIRDDETKAARLSKWLGRARIITPQFLVQTLRQGEIELFEQAFAELTGLHLRLARRILFQSGGEELAVACKAVGIDKADFASIFLRTRSARPGNGEIDPRELPRAMSFFDDLDPNAAKALHEEMQRDPDFPGAGGAADHEGPGPAVSSAVRGT